MPDPHPKVYAVSACLLGILCRYDRGHKRNSLVLNFLQGKSLVPVCPELLTGLPMPRPPAEISDGDGRAVLSGEARVRLADGSDVTEAFLIGARQALEWVKLAGATCAILKERSPSCGVREIYRQGQTVPGQGVFAALLIREGLEVFSEEQIELGL